MDQISFPVYMRKDNQFFGLMITESELSFTLFTVIVTQHL